jgi:hypothetical protein
MGELEPTAAESVDEHLFSCDACAQAFERLGALIAGLRELVPPVISHAHRARLAAAGVVIRETQVEPDIVADARFSPEIDLLVHVLRAQLGGVERVDLEVVGADGQTIWELEHVPFDEHAGEVLIACQRHYGAELTGDPEFRLHAVSGGVRRALGTYLVRHHVD